MIKSVCLLVIFLVAVLLTNAQSKTFGFTYKQDSLSKKYIVKGILKNSPAAISKLSIGDELLLVNGQSTINRNGEEIKTIFTLAPNTCKFTINRNGQQKQLIITKQDRIKVYDNAKEYGTITLGNRGSYVGEMVAGEILHGKGKFTHSSGRIYEGNYINNELIGNIILTWPDGYRYEGAWLKDERNGLGTYFYTNGDYIKGNWVNDKLDGEVEWYVKIENSVKKLIYKNGLALKNDEASNSNSNAIFETYTTTDGGKYEGYTINKLPHGKGKLTFKNGDIYDGDWVDGFKTGIGTINFINGDKYVGSIKNGIYDGFGKFISKNGDFLEGNFLNGKLNGKGKGTYPNVGIYDGDWVNNSAEGYGIFYYADGRKYSGSFKNGKRDGKGVFTNKEGTSYTGTFIKDYEEGEFIKTSKTGKQTKSNFLNGVEVKPYDNVKDIIDEDKQVKKENNEQDKKLNLDKNITPSTSSTETLYNIIGNIKNLENKTPNADYIVFKAKLKGNVSGYKTLMQAKDTAKYFAGNEIIMQNKLTKQFLIYSAVTVENTTINSTIANSPFNSQLTNTPKVDLSYDNIKMNFDRQLTLVKDNEASQEKAIDILDEDGLSLINDDITGNVGRGTRGMSMILDNELLHKNFNEAKRAYMYFDRVTSATPNLDVVKTFRKNNLTKMYSFGPIFKDFVETQMTKYNFTEAEKNAVRGK